MINEILILHGEPQNLRSFIGKQLLDMYASGELELEIGDVVLKSPAKPNLVQRSIQNRQRAILGCVSKKKLTEAYIDYHTQWTHAAIWCGWAIAEMTPKKLLDFDSESELRISSFSEFISSDDRFVILKYTPLLFYELQRGASEPSADDLRTTISNLALAMSSKKFVYRKKEAVLAAVDASMLSWLHKLNENRFHIVKKTGAFLMKNYAPIRFGLPTRCGQSVESATKILNFSQCANFVMFIVGTTIYPAQFRMVSGRNILPCMISASEFFIPSCIPVELK